MSSESDLGKFKCAEKWDPISCKSKDMARNCGKCPLFPPNLSKMGPRESTYAMHSVCRSLHWRKTVVKSPSGVLGIREGRERERERERLSGAIKLLKYGIGGGTSLDSSVQSRQPVAKAKGKGSV